VRSRQRRRAGRDGAGGPSTPGSGCAQQRGTAPDSSSPARGSKENGARFTGGVKRWLTREDQKSGWRDTLSALRQPTRRRRKSPHVPVATLKPRSRCGGRLRHDTMRRVAETTVRANLREGRVGRPCAVSTARAMAYEVNCYAAPRSLSTRHTARCSNTPRESTERKSSVARRL
jgi:hypothetical protein